jgi:structural maintenance of chromosomes protein 6
VEVDTLNGLKSELRDCQSAVDEATERLEQIRHEKQDWHDQSRRLKDQLQRRQERVDTLEEELANAAPAEEGVIEALQADLQTAEEEKSFQEGQLADGLSERERLNSDQRTLKDEMDNLQNQIDEIEAVLSKLDVKANKLRTKREEALREKNRALERVDEAKAEEVSAKQRHEELLREVAELEEAARQICQERVAIPPEETPQSLEAKMNHAIETREKCERE